MPIKSRNEDVQIQTSVDDPISLTITFGNAQIGGNIIKDMETNALIAKGRIEKLPLGKGSDFQGKTLNITSNILDVNDQSNGVVVTYFFQSAQSAVFTFHDKVDNDGDIFSFIVDFKFI